MPERASLAVKCCQRRGQRRKRSGQGAILAGQFGKRRGKEEEGLEAKDSPPPPAFAIQRARVGEWRDVQSSTRSSKRHSGKEGREVIRGGNKALGSQKEGPVERR